MSARLLQLLILRLAKVQWLLDRAPLQRTLQIQLLRARIETLLVLVLLLEDGFVQIVLADGGAHQRGRLLLVHLRREEHVVSLALLVGKPLLP